MSALTDVLSTAAQRTAAAADILNELDGVAGDGDMGVTVTTGARLLEEVLATVADKPVADVLQACGLTLAKGAPSTIGTLIATGFLRAAAAAQAIRTETAAATLAALLSAATNGISERGGATRGSKTILDALLPAVEAADEAAAAGEELRSALGRIAAAAEVGAAETASMRAVHGRAGWLADRSFGHEDAGARLGAIAQHAAATACSAPGSSDS